MFRMMRWPETNGEPVCPRCAAQGAYVFATRAVFKCRTCAHQFTPTSGTFLAGRKLPLRDYLLALVLFVTASRGKSAIQWSHEVETNYRTAWRLGGLIRTAIWNYHQTLNLSGEVEVDGAFFGGHFVVANVRRPGGKRFVKGNFVNRRVVVVARERRGKAITFCGLKESDALVWLRRHVEFGSTIIADEAHAWDGLKTMYAMIRIRHKDFYSFKGQSTNLAESFHSRMRKHLSTHGHISGKHMPIYAAEMAWRENTRRLTSRARFADLFAICFLYGGKIAKPEPVADIIDFPAPAQAVPAIAA